jgi:predicted nuclease of predicted toxin-antitoxin system
VRLYLDENMSRHEVAALRDAGHDVVYVNEVAGLRSRPDAAHARTAQLQRRVLITKDADFGRLREQQRLPTTGVVYIKRSAALALDLPDRLVGVLEEHAAALARGAFLVVDRERVRIREIGELS